jgi:hypothetical protein
MVPLTSNFWVVVLEPIAIFPFDNITILSFGIVVKLPEPDVAKIRSADKLLFCLAYILADAVVLVVNGVKSIPHTAPVTLAVLFLDIHNCK